MLKYKKKAIIVRAEQFLPDAWEKLTPDHFAKFGIFPDAYGYTGWAMKTKSGKSEIANGDYIIEEIDGSGYYPCKETIFKETYDLEEENETWR